MTSHDLARRLLEGPDAVVWVQVPFYTEETINEAVSLRYDTLPNSLEAIALITTTHEEVAA